MENPTPDLWTLIFLFIPGFISVTVYDRVIPSPRRDSKALLTQAIAYGALNFGVLFALIPRIAVPSWAFAHPIIIAAAFVALPAAWPVLLLRFLRSRWLRPYFLHPTNRAWDYVFGLKQSFWVLAHLHDGRTIGGIYEKKSFVSSLPYEDEIYLEELWELDDKRKFLRPIPRTKGALIQRKDIAVLEILGN